MDLPGASFNAGEEQKGKKREEERERAHKESH